MKAFRRSKSAITTLEAILAIVVIVVAVVAVYFAVRPAPEPPAPGEFELSDLVVEPTEVDEGDSVAISVDVENVGETDVTGTVTLMLNDAVEDSEEVTLEAGESETVSFTLTKSAGDYDVAIFGTDLTGAFTVLMEIKNPDTFIYATIGEPATFDPAWCYDTASAEAIFNIYDTLIFFKHDPEKYIPKYMTAEELTERTDEFEPLLATEVPSVDNGLISADGLTYTFPIREGVTFSNGNPLTPEDVEYSIERAMVQDRDGGPVWMFLEPLLGVYGTRDGDGNIVVPFEDIDAAVEVEGNNVVFHLYMTYPPFLQIMSQSWGSIVDKEWCIEQGDWDGTEAGYKPWPDGYNNPAEAEDTALWEKAMGTGPYKLVRWEHGVEYELIKNDDYWRGPARVTRAIVKYIEEWSTRKLMFMAGDVDFCDVPRAYMLEIIDAPGIRNIPDFSTLIAHAVFFTLDVDPASPHIWSGALDGEGISPDFFTDKDVRLGFTYAFDWETFIEDAWLGEAAQRASPVIDGLPYYNPDQPMYHFNLTKAEEHLKKAWGGQVWEKGFKMTLTYNIGNEYRRITCEILKRNVESLNDKFFIYVRAVTWPTFLADLVGSGMPAYNVGWLADYPDPHNFVHPFMHSEGAFAAWQKYSDPIVDALIEGGIKETDPEKRREIYYELQRIYIEDVPGFITDQGIGRHWERTWVQGWYYNPAGPGAIGYYFYHYWKGW